MPIPATASLSLGGVWPRPRTRRGTIVRREAPAASAAAAPEPRNRRRVILAMTVTSVPGLA
jgi:hypothetical protein